MQTISGLFTVTCVLLFAQFAVPGAARGEYLLQTQICLNYNTSRTVSTGHRFYDEFPPSPIKISCINSELALHLIKNQPCQSDHAPTSITHQPFQLPQPYPSCHLFTTAAFFGYFLCGIPKMTNGLHCSGFPEPGHTFIQRKKTRLLISMACSGGCSC